MQLRRIGIAIALLTVFAVDVWHVHDFLATPSLNDFGQFYASAQSFLRGGSLYQPTGSLEEATRPVVAANLNPPHWHALILPIARWCPLAVAGSVWVALSALGAATAFWVVARELKLKPAQLALLLLGAGIFGGTGAAIFNGQVAFVVAVPMVLAWRAARHEKDIAAGAWLGLCVTLKPFLLVFAPYYCLRRNWRLLGSASVAVVAILGLGILVFGASSYQEWLSTLARVHWTASPLNASLRGLLQRWFVAGNPYTLPLMAAPAVVLPLWAVSTSVVGLVAFRVLFRSVDTDLVFSLLIVTALLISPLGWVYYLWLAVGPLAVVLRRLCSARDLRFEMTFVAMIGLLWFPRALVLETPSILGTLIPGSVYGLGLLCLWGALVLDASNRVPLDAGARALVPTDA